jgi:hypothetical protein
VTAITGHKKNMRGSPCPLSEGCQVMVKQPVVRGIISFTSWIAALAALHSHQSKRTAERNCRHSRDSGCPNQAKKNGSLPEDKLPLRLCWGCLPLAIPAAACLASGFRANTLMVGGFPRVRLRFFASVSGPQLV